MTQPNQQSTYKPLKVDEMRPPTTNRERRPFPGNAGNGNTARGPKPNTQRYSNNNEQNDENEPKFERTKMCAFWLQNKCRKGNDCTYAHGERHLRINPNLYKTLICQLWLQGNCLDSFCKYAHGQEELRIPPDLGKTRLCKFFEKGSCVKGSSCRHAHGVEELRVNPGAFNTEGGLIEAEQLSTLDNAKASPPVPTSRESASPMPTIAPSPPPRQQSPSPLERSLRGNGGGTSVGQASNSEHSRTASSLHLSVTLPIGRLPSSSSVEHTSSVFIDDIPAVGSPSISSFISSLVEDRDYSIPIPESTRGIPEIDMSSRECGAPTLRNNRNIRPQAQPMESDVSFTFGQAHRLNSSMTNADLSSMQPHSDVSLHFGNTGHNFCSTDLLGQGSNIYPSSGLGLFGPSNPSSDCIRNDYIMSCPSYLNEDHRTYGYSAFPSYGSFASSLADDVGLDQLGMSLSALEPSLSYPDPMLEEPYYPSARDPSGLPRRRNSNSNDFKDLCNILSGEHSRPSSMAETSLPRRIPPGLESFNLTPPTHPNIRLTNPRKGEPDGVNSIRDDRSTGSTDFYCPSPDVPVFCQSQIIPREHVEARFDFHSNLL